MKIQITPKEFREMLPPELKELFDKLVSSMEEYGVDKLQAEAEVARQLFNATKSKAKGFD